MDNNSIDSVSIIILSYKNFDKIYNCVKSIYSQSYRNIQVVFSDDGSKNIDKNYINTVMKNELKEIEFVEIYNSKNLGTVKNFNNAIKESKGDLIIPLAIDDCFANENVVLDIVNFFNSTDYLIAGSYFLTQDKKDSFKLYPSPSYSSLFENNTKFKNSVITFGTPIRGANIYYRRSVFDLLGFFDERYFLMEDIPFLYNALSKNIKVGLVPSITIKYNTEGISGKKTGSTLLNNDRILFLSNILNDQKSFSIKRILKYRIERAKKPSNKFKHILKYPDVIIKKVLKKFHKDYKKFNDLDKLETFFDKNIRRGI